MTPLTVSSIQVCHLPAIQSLTRYLKMTCRLATPKAMFLACMQVQQHLEGPIGMALYEWQDGQIGMACVHGGIYLVMAINTCAMTATTSCWILRHYDLPSAWLSVVSTSDLV